MRANEQRDRFDELIDAGLRSYLGPAEIADPRIAAAQLLVRAREEHAARRRRWIWTLGIPVAACLLAAALIWLNRPPGLPRIAWVTNPAAGAPAPSPARPADLATPAQAKAVPSRAQVSRRHQPCLVPDTTRPCGLTLRPASAAGSVSQPPALPKLAVFPTPKPLSPQEAALVAVAVTAPPQIKAALVKTPKQPGDLSAVAAVKLPPFNPGGEPESTNEKEELP